MFCLESSEFLCQENKETVSMQHILPASLHRRAQVLKNHRPVRNNVQILFEAKLKLTHSLIQRISQAWSYLIFILDLLHCSYPYMGTDKMLKPRHQWAVRLKGLYIFSKPGNTIFWNSFIILFDPLLVLHRCSCGMTLPPAKPNDGENQSYTTGRTKSIQYRSDISNGYTHCLTTVHE